MDIISNEIIITISNLNAMSEREINKSYQNIKSQLDELFFKDKKRLSLVLEEVYKDKQLSIKAYALEKMLWYEVNLSFAEKEMEDFIDKLEADNNYLAYGLKNKYELYKNAEFHGTKNRLDKSIKNEEDTLLASQNIQDIYWFVKRNYIIKNKELHNDNAMMIYYIVNFINETSSSGVAKFLENYEKELDSLIEAFKKMSYVEVAKELGQIKNVIEKYGSNSRELDSLITHFDITLFENQILSDLEQLAVKVKLTD